MARTTVAVDIADINSANSTLQKFFSDHGYTAENIGGEVLMKNTLLTGLVQPWFIAVKNEPNKIILEGFIGKPHKKEQELVGFYGSAIKKRASKDMTQMVQLLGSNNIAESGNPAQTRTAVPSAPAYVPSSKPSTEHKAKFAYFSIGIGILAIILPLTSIFIGGLGLLIGVFLGIDSLNTSKRKIAIAGIVVNCLAVIPLIIAIIKQVQLL